MDDKGRLHIMDDAVKSKFVGRTYEENGLSEGLNRKARRKEAAELRRLKLAPAAADGTED